MSYEDISIFAEDGNSVLATKTYVDDWTAGTAPAKKEKTGNISQEYLDLFQKN